MDLLIVAQDFKLPKLLDKNVAALKNMPLYNLENNRRYHEMEASTIVKILTERLTMLEKNTSTSKGYDSNSVTRLSEFLKLYTDIRTSWMNKPTRGMMSKDAVWARAEKAMLYLRDKDSTCTHPYTAPDGEDSERPTDNHADSPTKQTKRKTGDVKTTDSKQSEAESVDKDEEVKDDKEQEDGPESNSSSSSSDSDEESDKNSDKESSGSDTSDDDSNSDDDDKEEGTNNADGGEKHQDKTEGD